MSIERATAVDDELVAGVARLVGQLSPGRAAPGRAELEAMLAVPGTHLLLARDGGEVVGMLTLVVLRLPSGRRGRIEDVVVDESARGRGLGAALTEEALQLATTAGAEAVELTSRPARDAANRLYRRLGFEQRETNVYVWRPG